MERREFLRVTTAATVSATTTGVDASGALRSVGNLDHDGTDAYSAGQSEEDAFWLRIRREYDPPADYADLDQANTGPTPRRVFDAYIARARRLSSAPAERFGVMWDDDLDVITRPALARYLGTAPERLAFTANATTSLNTVLHGFPLAAGDEVILTDHEYPDMVETLLQRAKRDGIVMRVVSVPTATEDAQLLVSRVADAIGARTRLVLISHVSAWSGVVLPVAEVCAVARGRGVAVLVDAAQSVGILDVNFDALGCDFLAASLHKGLGAPLPTGVLVMRQEHVGKVASLHPPSWDTSKHPMDLYEWSGTFNVAALATVTDALEFQRRLGAQRKRDRLQRLSAYWQDAVAGERGVRLLTPRARGRWCGPTAFAIDGIASRPLATHLRKSRGVLVQDKAGRHSPFTSAIRVSPGAHSTLAELDRLVEAVRAVARAGRLPAD